MCYDMMDRLALAFWEQMCFYKYGRNLYGGIRKGSLPLCSFNDHVNGT
jgi:hypothetical protein